MVYKHLRPVMQNTLPCVSYVLTEPILSLQRVNHPFNSEKAFQISLTQTMITNIFFRKRYLLHQIIHKRFTHPMRTKIEQKYRSAK